MIDPAVPQVRAPGRQPPVRIASYLFQRSRAQTSGCAALRSYRMDSRELRRSRTWRHTMAEGHYAVERTNPRFSFFADAELSSRCCYIDALEPIPIRTKLRLSICDGTNTCELHGKVLYMHSGGGFGIFGMGVLFEEMGAEQHSSIDAWLRKLAGRPGKDLGKNSFSQIKG